jgi:putative PIN family toxin of toxin-antitoxin system
MRLVFDTNVLISALLFEQSTPGRAFFTTLEQGEILLSAQLGSEILKTLHKRKFSRYITPGQRDAFLVALVQSSTLVEVSASILVCRDPKDNMLLELAVSGKADAIITGDSDLLVLHPFKEIAILTPEAFLTTFLPANS